MYTSYRTNRITSRDVELHVLHLM